MCKSHRLVSSFFFPLCRQVSGWLFLLLFSNHGTGDLLEEQDPFGGHLSPGLHFLPASCARVELINDCCAELRLTLKGETAHAGEST